MSSVWHAIPQLQKIENQLVIDGCRATDLVREFGSPLYVYSENRIREKYRRLLQAYRKHYPKFEIFYAVKANNNPAIVQILSQEGAGADCSCVGEMEIASQVGVPPEKQLFTAVFPSRKDLQTAVAKGAIVNIENLADLPHINKVDILSFRINPGHGESGSEGLVFAGPDAKFGIPSTQIEEAYAYAKAIGVKRFGAHMMTGSNILTPEYFGKMTEQLLDIIGPIAKKLNLHFEFIDIGGSLGIPYRPDQIELDMEATAESVVRSLKKKLEEYALQEPLLIQEPGRYLVADAGILLTTVISVKDATPPFLGLDAGMNTLLRPALYKTYHHVLLANNLQASYDSPYNLVGPICENTDMFAAERLLPRNISSGDLLALLDTGAYGFSMSSQYNTQPRAAEVLVCDGQAELIRHREDLSDIIRKVSIPARLKTYPKKHR